MNKFIVNIIKIFILCVVIMSSFIMGVLSQSIFNLDIYYVKLDLAIKVQYKLNYLSMYPDENVRNISDEIQDDILNY